MLRYRPVKQVLSTPGLGDYLSYGLEAISGDAARVALISDVSCDPEFVACLAEKCTLLGLDPIHILDVILDALP